MKLKDPRPTLEEIAPGEPVESNDRIPTDAQRKRDGIQAKLKARGKKAEGVGRGAKSFVARDVARRLVTDKKYLKELQNRLRGGVAGNIEIWLWRYAGGDPQKNEEEIQRERVRFEKMREQVLQFLKEAPDRAHVLDGAVQRAPRLLARPMPKPLPIDITALSIKTGTDDGDP